MIRREWITTMAAAAVYARDGLSAQPNEIARHGLVYVPFEADAWKMQLVKELKAAGFDVDANKAF
jgi:hypothetical protein